MDLREKILALSAVNAPSGFECIAALEPFGGQVLDAMGNILIEKPCGKSGAKRLMLTAHIDEIGLIVTGVEDGGFLRFDTLGGVDPRQLPAREVRILADETLFGVICTMPPHVLSAEEQDKPIDIDKLFIDVGFSKEKAKELVKPGTPVVFESYASDFGNGSVLGKAMDDRACVAVILETLERLDGSVLEIDVCALFTTQEELGHRGAATGAYTVNPDCCIALDATFGKSLDSPDNKTFALGSGPAIGVGPNLDRGLTAKLFDTAQEASIKYQTEVLHGNSGTDAWPIQISREGVRTALLSIPVKYMHSPFELLDLQDAEDTVKLLCAFIAKMGVGT